MEKYERAIERVDRTLYLIGIFPWDELIEFLNLHKVFVEVRVSAAIRMLSDARVRFKKRLDEAMELKRMLKRGEGDKDIQPGGDIDEGEDKAVPQAPRPVHTG